MNGIDEVSKTLDTLLAEVSHIRKSTDEANGKIDALTSSGILQGASLTAAHKRLDTLEPIVTSLDNLRNKGLGVLFTFCMLSGVAGVTLQKIVSRIIDAILK